MQRRRFIAYTSLLALSNLIPGRGLLAANQPPLTETTPPLLMGIFPRRNPKQTFKLFSPMAQYLGEQLQREVRLVTAKNFRQFWKGVQQQRYDLVHYNQYHYIVSNKLYGYEVILRNQEFGQTGIAGAIVVRKDSGINRISDLEGKTIIFGGGKMAMQSYIAAKWLLEQGGLSTGDYQERFAINPPNAIISAYYKQGDAAGAGDLIIRLEAVNRQIDISELKFLAQTSPLPHLPWAVKQSMPSALKQRLQTTLSQLPDSPAGLRILNQARLNALIITEDRDYNPHRKIVADVYGQDYGIEQFK